VALGNVDLFRFFLLWCEGKRVVEDLELSLLMSGFLVREVIGGFVLL
jgi:hypothetical protein